MSHISVIFLVINKTSMAHAKRKLMSEIKTPAIMYFEYFFDA
ncbi:hypothetical protein [Ferroplasma sp.]|nr:hypothetical protein [Ferroplasma sp.]